jgi:hypothetical protein
MKRISYVWLSLVIVASVLVPVSRAQDTSGDQQPSLGSFARNLRKDKDGKPTSAKKFDNDNLPMEDKLSVVGNGSDSSVTAADSQGTASGSDTASGQDATKDAAKTPEKMPTVQPGQSQEERQQVYDKWSQKLTEQKDKVNDINRDLDLLQREYKLRAAELYGDAGSRLRNESQWDKEDTDYKQKIAEKQKELDQAKQGMDDLQEDARKAGVPESQREQVQDSNSQ